ASKVTACLDDLEIVFRQGIDEDMKRDLDTIKHRMIDRLIPLNASEERILGLVDALNDEGAWPDIDYESDSRAAWDVANHMGRLATIARTWATPGHALHHDATVLDGILRAYDYWMQLDPIAPNWWHNEIGVPRQLYRAMLMIADELSEEQMAAGLRVLERAKLGMTGQNLVWVAEVSIARGCLADDPLLVMAAFNAIEDEIAITTGEGIQPDFSFYQHGEQLYSGGYGRGFSVDCPMFAALADGTAFAFDDEKIEILSSYLLDGQQWMIRGGTFDYSACGREVSRKGGGGARSLIHACRAMLQLEPPRASEFEAFMQRLEAGDDAPPELQLSGNRSFWRSEFMTHHRPEWYMSVRMTSPLVVQSETANSENLRGQLLSDGVTYIMRGGDEYRQIFPVWDWRRLPGITAELTPDPPGIENGRRGERSFVGGISDGEFGAAVMDFARDDLLARKAWFFFHDAAVCLGAGISSTSDHPVLTSLNQCHARGPVTLADADGSRELDGGLTSDSIEWVHHDGFAYLLPEPATVRVSNEEQTGSWWEINPQYAQEELSLPVFSIGIEHGAGPEDASYVYLVAPAEDATGAEALAADLPVRLLANSAQVQAVADASAGVHAGAFHEAGELELADGLTVAVSAPCLLMVRETDDGLAVTAANPENEALALDVTLSQRLEGDGCSWDEAAGESTAHFDLPGEMYAGQSVTRELRRE
ncbi:MAG: polysaccharide lyase 8 family protein, partial [Armatimonadota bacterium]